MLTCPGGALGGVICPHLHNVTLFINHGGPPQTSCTTTFKFAKGPEWGEFDLMTMRLMLQDLPSSLEALQAALIIFPDGGNAGDSALVKLIFTKKLALLLNVNLAKLS